MTVDMYVLCFVCFLAVCLIAFALYNMIMLPLEIAKNEIEYDRYSESQTQLFRPDLKQSRVLKTLARLKSLENLAFLILHNSKEGRLRYYRFFLQRISFLEPISLIQTKNTEARIELRLQTRTMITVITIKTSDYEEYRNFEAKPVTSETVQTCGAKINSDDSSQNCNA